LDQGRIIERGTHAELLSLKGRYAALYQQFVQVDDQTWDRPLGKRFFWLFTSEESCFLLV